MGGRQRRPPVTSIGRFARGRRLDRNPLRRASDRAETVLLVLLLLAFLVGAPLAALASGAWAHASAQRAELAQQSSGRQVTAVLLVAPPAPSFGSGGVYTYSQARWMAPDGRAMTGLVPVIEGMVVGARVSVWATQDGQLTAPPMGDSQVTARTVLGAVSGVTAVTVLLALAGLLVRLSLNRRRMAGWEADWRAAGPRWTTRA